MLDVELMEGRRHLIQCSFKQNRTEQFCVSVNAPQLTSWTSSPWWHQPGFITLKDLAHWLHEVQLHVFSEPLSLSDKPSSMLLSLMKQGHQALSSKEETHMWCRLDDDVSWQVKRGSDEACWAGLLRPGGASVSECLQPVKTPLWSAVSSVTVKTF